jgi:acetyl esterase
MTIKSKWMNAGIAAFAAVLVAAATPSLAQQNTPPDIKKQLIEGAYGRGGQGARIYEQTLAKAPKAGIKVTKDLAYGKHDRQKVDVYQPEGKKGLPILAFFHGGGYVGGARDTSPETHGNVLYYFANNGFLGVNADFRLAPEFQWPSGGQDVAAVVRWLKENAAKYGGDPNRIYLMGTSAGSSHIAQYAFDRRFQPDSGAGISGVILQSGRYWLDPNDLDNPGLQGGVQAYFGKDPKTYESRSVTNHVMGSTVPAMLLLSEFDQRNLTDTTGMLFTALCQRDAGLCPRLIQLKYHNHGSQFQHMNTSEDYLGKEILEWIHEGFGSTRKGFAQD